MIPVMLIDDQRPTRLGFSMMLRADPSIRVVAQAGDGQEALNELDAMHREERPLPRVALMDVRMPAMDGIDATAEIAKRYPDVKVIILTTYDQDSYAFGGLAAGASGFLLKDVRANDLCKAIHAVAAGDAILTPRVTREVLAQGLGSTRRATRQAELQGAFSSLTPRELDVAGLVADGLNNAEIAERLGIQPDSVKKTITRILDKLGLRDRLQIAVAWYKADMDHDSDGLAWE
ncbi:response regulator [Bifidobacterium vansinderenii]|uniref:DNA-binding response regulator n=1 Tax=Bifidobacterium vansinderenii TaxID=1984871 RepID=A0A229W0A0_9BIFI|nr:response regulator transcription factor [Bifidobacterium vansinderenii]OXN01297.1 DNA-binding response regulator [Bifidobacterium vansinderenii]